MRCIWKRKLSGVTVTFVLLRYSAILYSFAVLAQHAIFGPENRLTYVVLHRHNCKLTYKLRCEYLGHFAAIISGCTYLGLSSECCVRPLVSFINWIAVFCTLRVYAITGMNIRIAALVCVLLTTPVVVLMVRMQRIVCQFS